MPGDGESAPIGLEETRVAASEGASPDLEATMAAPSSTPAPPGLEATVLGDPSPADTNLDATIAGSGTLSPAARSIAEGLGEPPPRADPDRIGRHVVVDRLGAGGMGVVYAAYDPELDRKIAVKLIREDPSGGTDASQGRARLLREAQAMAKLSHPNVIQVYDVGTHEGQVYIAMEFVDGRTLGDWASETGRDWKAIVDKYLLAARGLAEAHRAGLIHRDFKPDNVLVGKDGRVRVLDFGLARSGKESEPDDAPRSEVRPGREASISSGTTLDAALTTTGAVMGTPAYMSPEQFAGEPTDPSTDQFSFCVALLEALEGRRPFEGDTMASLSFNVLEGKVRDAPADGRAPSWVRRVLVRGLARKPAERWASMDALIDALEHDPARSRRQLLLAGGLVVGLAGAIYGGMRYQATLEDRCDATAQWDGVWDEARRAELLRGFEATGLAFADETFAAVGQRVDGLVDSWNATFRRTCEGRGELGEAAAGARMACLESRQHEIEAALELLATSDETAVRRAFEVVLHLDDPAQCEDPAYLAIQVRPPEDPETAATALELRQELATVRSLEDAGKYREASERADGVVERARPLHHPPLTAEALARAGRLQVLRGDDRAVATLEEAFRLGYAHAHDHAAFEAATELVLAIGRDRGNPRRGEDWAELADAALLRIGDRAADRARLDLARARVAVLSADFDRAHQLARSALDTAEKVHGADDPMTARYLVGLAKVLEEKGDYDEAQRRYEQALAIRKAHLGPNHPELSSSLAGLGSLHLRRAEYDEALELYEQALKIEEQAGGDSRGLQDALNGMGNVHAYKLQPERALEYYERALASCERLFGPDHPDMAKYTNNVGLQHFEMGELGLADEFLRRAIELDERKLGEDHPALAYALSNLAQVEYQRGHAEQALEHLSRAIDLEVRGLGPDHINVAGRLSDRGSLYGLLERWDEAEADLVRGLAIEVENREPTDPQIGWSHFNLGDLQQRRGRPEAAPVHYERALAIFTAEPGDPNGVGWANLSLAFLAERGGDATAAVQHLEAALVAFESEESVDAEGLSSTARFLASALRRGDPERAKKLLARAEELTPAEPEPAPGG